jgi:hypothetical protein
LINLKPKKEGQAKATKQASKAVQEGLWILAHATLGGANLAGK